MNDTVVNAIIRDTLGSNNEEILRTVIEAVANVDVIDMQVNERKDHVEVWMKRPSALTGEELRSLQRIFEVHEIGVYGDPLLAGTEEDTGLEGTFHMLVTPDVEP